jgi:hypothetical protein
MLRPCRQTTERFAPTTTASLHLREKSPRQGEAREAMEALVESLPPEQLNRVGFRLYERFRPDVPAGAERWGSEGRIAD